MYTDNTAPLWMQTCGRVSSHNPSLSLFLDEQWGMELGVSDCNWERRNSLVLTHSRPAQNLLAIGAKLHPWCTEAGCRWEGKASWSARLDLLWIYVPWLDMDLAHHLLLPTYSLPKRVSRLQWSWHQMHACVSMSLSIYNCFFGGIVKSAT
jgi:hypothetical protein